MPRTAKRTHRHNSFQLARDAVASFPVKRTLLVDSVHAPKREYIDLDENPNSVKRGAARLGTTLAEARAYSPLTVQTPSRDTLGRRAPRMAPSSYTV